MKAFVSLLGAWIAAAWFTLAGVEATASGWASPLGYTRSLTLWLAPVAVLMTWFFTTPTHRVKRKALLSALLVLVPMGFGLDVLFGTRFFHFPDPEATLGLDLPAVGGEIPIEEYAFYFFGFLTILLLYVWADEYFLHRYDVEDYADRWARLGVERPLSPHLGFVGLGVAILVVGILYKARVAPPGYRGGFPSYFGYLVFVSLVPTAILFRSVRAFVNWRAVTLTLVLVLLVSVVWEVTLALPLGWWAYQPTSMLGVVVPAWHDLPIEAVLVWFAATLTVVAFYEAMKLWQWLGAPTPEKLPPRVRSGLRSVYGTRTDA